MDKTNKPISMPEHLSAVFDDESGTFEQKRVIDELCSNQTLKDKMCNYALIGDAMRSGDSNHQTLSLGESFLVGIHDKLDAEETYQDVVVDHASDSLSEKNNSWVKPVGGFALAASLAAVAVVGVQNFQSSQQTDQVTIASSQKPVEQLSQKQMDNAISISADKISNGSLSTEAPELKKGSEEIYKQANAKTRSLLKRYVDSHMQYASTAAFVPSVRVIAYADYQ